MLAQAGLVLWSLLCQPTHPYTQSDYCALGDLDLGRYPIFAFYVLAPSQTPMVALFQIFGEHWVVSRPGEIPLNECWAW